MDFLDLHHIIYEITENDCFLLANNPKTISYVEKNIEIKKVEHITYGLDKINLYKISKFDFTKHKLKFIIITQKNEGYFCTSDYCDYDKIRRYFEKLQTYRLQSYEMLGWKTTHEMYFLNACGILDSNFKRSTIYNKALFLESLIELVSSQNNLSMEKDFQVGNEINQLVSIANDLIHGRKLIDDMNEIQEYIKNTKMEFLKNNFEWFLNGEKI